MDGTFVEEPGSGAVATVENKQVSVGTFDWVQRYCGIDNFIQSTRLLQSLTLNRNLCLNEKLFKLCH